MVSLKGGCAFFTLVLGVLLTFLGSLLRAGNLIGPAKEFTTEGIACLCFSAVLWGWVAWSSIMQRARGAEHDGRGGSTASTALKKNM